MPAPPGRRLVVFSRRVREGPGETASGIFVVGIDGKRPAAADRRGADFGGDVQPSFYPSGRQIVFECANYMRRGIECSNEHICSVRPDGSHRRDLTPRFESGQEAFDPNFSARTVPSPTVAPRRPQVPRNAGYNEPAFSLWRAVPGPGTRLGASRALTYIRVR